MILDSFNYQDDHMVDNGHEKLVFRMNSGTWMHRTISVTTAVREAAMRLDMPINSIIGNER